LSLKTIEHLLSLSPLGGWFDCMAALSVVGAIYTHIEPIRYQCVDSDHHDVLTPCTTIKWTSLKGHRTWWFIRELVRSMYYVWLLYI